jgi:hypothetical protein
VKILSLEVIELNHRRFQQRVKAPEEEQPIVWFDGEGRYFDATRARVRESVKQALGIGGDGEEERLLRYVKGEDIIISRLLTRISPQLRKFIRKARSVALYTKRRDKQFHCRYGIRCDGES